MSGISRRALLGATGLTALAALTGCAPTGSPTGATTPTPEGTSRMTTEPTQTSSVASILIVFFSRPGENYWEGGRRDLETGNTKVIADMIAERVHCDVYEIHATDPYPDAYDPTVERNQQEQNQDARPGIDGELPILAGYDTIIIGSPVWNVRAPMIMSTFIESVDLKGKTLHPFVTYAVSGMAGIDTDYRDALPDTTVTDGLAIRGEDARDSSAQVETWLRSHGLL